MREGEQAIKGSPQQKMEKQGEIKEEKMGGRERVENRYMVKRGEEMKLNEDSLGTQIK